MELNIDKVLDGIIIEKIREYNLEGNADVDIITLITDMPSAWVKESMNRFRYTGGIWIKDHDGMKPN